MSYFNPIQNPSRLLAQYGTLEGICPLCSVLKLLHPDTGDCPKGKPQSLGYEVDPETLPASLARAMMAGQRRGVVKFHGVGLEARDGGMGGGESRWYRP